MKRVHENYIGSLLVCCSQQLSEGGRAQADHYPVFMALQHLALQLLYSPLRSVGARPLALHLLLEHHLRLVVPLGRGVRAGLNGGDARLLLLPQLLGALVG